MDTTVLLAAVSIAAVLLIIAGVAVSRSGKLAVAGGFRPQSPQGVGVATSSAVSAPSPRPASFTASPVLEFPAVPEAPAASPFAPAARA
ncbi:MAG: hypothetical protein ACKOWF_03350, partial [Chloroflexota bacterium]